MVLPASKKRLARLGDALVRGATTEEDERLFEQFLGCCDTALATVTSKLVDAGLPTPVSRVKTRDTMIDKLRRQPNLALTNMDDIAGVRIVVEGDRNKQNQVVAIVRSLFETDEGLPTVKDRRVTPSFGYRAVHVLLRVDEVRVEVQVRTVRQHLGRRSRRKLPISLDEASVTGSWPMMPGVRR